MQNFLIDNDEAVCTFIKLKNYLGRASLGASRGRSSCN